MSASTDRRSPDPSAVGLGCGSLIAIALIVFFLGRADIEPLRQEIAGLREEVSSLRATVEGRAQPSADQVGDPSNLSDLEPAADAAAEPAGGGVP